MIGFRVKVDQYPHPTVAHQEATGVSAVLTDGDQVAEVQVAKRGGDLVVVIAGLYGYTVNDRGHLVIHVMPTDGVAKGGEGAARGRQ